MGEIRTLKRFSWIIWRRNSHLEQFWLHVETSWLPFESSHFPWLLAPLFMREVAQYQHHIIRWNSDAIRWNSTTLRVNSNTPPFIEKSTDDRCFYSALFIIAHIFIYFWKSFHLWKNPVSFNMGIIFSFFACLIFV